MRHFCIRVMPGRARDPFRDQLRYSNGQVCKCRPLGNLWEPPFNWDMVGSGSDLAGSDDGVCSAFMLAPRPARRVKGTSSGVFRGGSACWVGR